ncbi:methionyl-tRNA formyltransferase [Atopobacter sp. AH10]|uniref:methionyl-tRNA formyltransferase n=1 Tax=Atopobacter sp. AH10 TaxID=2315861 RepID=UPI000EF22F6B|nr:methionyl-tRNA formyltransferase [Atopobacter sp. AH10]RLK64041.1 methionyl-tRNA formyltransferase [Atopobacter sp. AH10]
MLKIIFMGTPEFSVGPLRALHEHPDFTIVAVVTQPDKPVGRKRKLQAPPVKEAATSLAIPVFQPTRIRDKEAVKKLRDLHADILVTAAYGQFLPKSLLEASKYGAVNIHASLLPKYRGGAPVHYAILNGDQESGITYMEMVQEMDAGDILAQYSLSIAEDETTGQLFKELSDLASKTVADTLLALVEGKLKKEAQDPSQVSFSPNIPPEMEVLDWQESALALIRKIRAFNPYPGAYVKQNGKRLKIWQASLKGPLPKEDLLLKSDAGDIVVLDKANLGILCGDGKVIYLKEIQPSGKNPMPIKSYMNGQGRQLTLGENFNGNKEESH